MTNDQPEWPTFSESDDDVDMLVKLSRFYGQSAGFVIAGGGNTSCKTPDRLYVKASGTQLATLERSGLVLLDRDRLEKLANAQLPDNPVEREAQYKQAVLGARLEPDRGQRPSVECLLHHLIAAKFVVHSHATIVNALTCSRQGEQIAHELFGKDLLWIPFVDPGYVLGRVLQEKLSAYLKDTNHPFPRIVLLANHGVIVSGDSPAEVKATTDLLMKAVSKKLGPNWCEQPFGPCTVSATAASMINVIGPALRALTEGRLGGAVTSGVVGPALNVATFDDSPLVKAFVGTDAGRTLPAQGPLNPDQIVYCNSFPLHFAPGEGGMSEIVEQLRAAIGEHRDRYGCMPRVVLVRGVGLFGVGEDFKSAATSRDLFKDAIEILAGATRFGGPTFLSDGHRRFIEEWEVEAYRKQVARNASAGGRVAGKIAVVTGAAQGFGREISQAFAADGGSVVLADINQNGARTGAAEICSVHGKGRAIGLGMDVTRPESIAACLHETVRTYGGFDVLISNAGVLRAESVKSQSERDFDFVTAVNYKGYFFCVQQAAPILAAQHKAQPAYLSDIIQINSKSGLQGSNRNGAYAGSKFGGIGLTQSFALELIEDGIKVNAICPGNFFDGPLWSDPETGLFAQYLRTGKVPGAKSVADVRKFYEAKVPMNRGCTTADVMKAIYYLMEQQYETGQALPVTGGQVMLS